MGRENRLWRKLVKKLRRKRKRQNEAIERLSQGGKDVCSGDDQEENSDDQVHEQMDTDFFLSKEEWEEREAEAELESTMKQIEMERIAKSQAESQRKIREEWEAKQEHERIVREEKERIEKQLKDIQVLYRREAEFDEFLSFLSGDIETPPTKYLLPEVEVDEASVCYYFARTAACRFYERCMKVHSRPTLSTAILIPNFFTHFKLEQSTRDEYDTDLGLEYEDKDLYNEFLEFYNDVVPELRKYGTLLQFKVCCNLEPHLRGNVYIQYNTIKESVEAYRKLHGRYFNGKQLSLQFIKMDSWRSAICGAFLRKACTKGRTCNFLHVFRNPTTEFVNADRDWKERIPPISVQQYKLSATKHLDAQNGNASNKSNTVNSKSISIESLSEDDIRHQRSKASPSNAKPRLSCDIPSRHSKHCKRKRSKSSTSIKHKKKKRKKEKKAKKKKRRSEKLQEV